MDIDNPAPAASGQGAEPMDTDEGPLKEYVLSAILQTADEPVRKVQAVDDDTVVAITKTGQPFLFKRQSKNEFKGSKPFPEPLHDLANALEVMPTSMGVPKGTLASSGKPGMVRFWSTEGRYVEPRKLEGHKETINSVAFTADGGILTGSYDSTARLWRNAQTVATLDGDMHKYGVEVCGLPSGEIVTGSYKNVALWDKDGKHTKTVKDAHGHMVRCIKPHPLGFATCANDGFVKVWSNKGELLQSIHAHPIADDEKNQNDFIYDMHILKDNSLVSCGEDGSVRIFSPEGKLVQKIMHPATVWSVAGLPNGDLVTGSADTQVRLWTRDKSRKASDEAIKSHDDLVKMAAVAAGADSINPDMLADPIVLTTEGKPGEIKVVQMEEGPTVFQYDAQKKEWTKVGLAMGQAKAKPKIGGVEYDHVTEVQIDNKKIQLGFNRWQDPLEVATAFCHRYQIDLDDRINIVNHLKPYASSQARNKWLKEQAEKENQRLRHIPAHKITRYEITSKWKMTKMKEKLLEENGKLLLNEEAVDVKSKEAAWDGLMEALKDPGRFPGTQLLGAQQSLVMAMLKWPTANILAVMDMCRVMCLNESFLKYTAEGDEFWKLINMHLESDDCTLVQRMLVCKLVANWMAKRPRTQEERQGKYNEALGARLSEVLSNLSECASSDKEVHRKAYIILCLNVILWLGKLQVRENDIYLVMSSGLCEALEKDHNDVNLYYILSVLGTMAFVSKSTKEEIKDSFEDVVKDAIKKGQAAKTKSTVEIANEVHRVFFLQ